MDVASLWDKGEATFDQLSLHPICSLDQESLREALLAERPAPLLRFSEEKAKVRMTIALDVISLLCDTKMFVRCPKRENRVLTVTQQTTRIDITLAAACVRGDLLPVMVQCDALASKQSRKDLAARIAKEAKENNVLAVEMNDGVAWCILATFIGS